MGAWPARVTTGRRRCGAVTPTLLGRKDATKGWMRVSSYLTEMLLQRAVYAGLGIHIADFLYVAVQPSANRLTERVDGHDRQPEWLAHEVVFVVLEDWRSILAIQTPFVSDYFLN